MLAVQGVGLGSWVGTGPTGGRSLAGARLVLTRTAPFCLQRSRVAPGERVREGDEHRLGIGWMECTLYLCPQEEYADTKQVYFTCSR